MSDGRTGVGVVVGVGLGLGAAAVLLIARRASAMAVGSPREPRPLPPREPVGTGAYADRYRSLRARGAQGARWAGPIAQSAPPGFTDPIWTSAVTRWIGIESGGDPTNVTGANELGLLQVNRSYASELGFTQDELSRYVARGTSDADRANLSWRYVRALAVPLAGVATPDQKSRAWLAYMRHALPLALHELAAQGFLSEGPGSAKMDAAWEQYQPSPRASSFSTSKVGTPGQQVLLRFVAAADAVAGYDRSARWT